MPILPHRFRTRPAAHFLQREERRTVLQQIVPAEVCNLYLFQRRVPRLRTNLRDRFVAVGKNMRRVSTKPSAYFLDGVGVQWDWYRLSRFGLVRMDPSQPPYHIRSPVPIARGCCDPVALDAQRRVVAECPYY